MALLTLAVALQAADVYGLARRIADNGRFGFRDPLESRFWTVVPPHYGQMLLIPSNLCAHAAGVDQTSFLLRAGVFAMGINGGWAARYDVRRAEQYCEELQQDVAHGRWSHDALYILRPDLLSSTKAGAGDWDAVSQAIFNAHAAERSSTIGAERRTVSDIGKLPQSTACSHANMFTSPQRIVTTTRRKVASLG